MTLLLCDHKVNGPMNKGAIGVANELSTNEYLHRFLACTTVIEALEAYARVAALRLTIRANVTVNPLDHCQIFRDGKVSALGA